MAKKEYFKKRYDFSSFSVIVQNHSISFIIKDEESGEEIEHFLPSMFFNNELGLTDSLLQIKWKDRWGSEMVLTNYEPTSLRGMFEFIGRAYAVPFFSYGDFPAITMTKQAIEESIREELEQEEAPVAEAKVEENVEKDEELEDGQILTGFIDGFPSRVDIRVDAFCAGIYCPVCSEAVDLSNKDTDPTEALGMKCSNCGVQLVLHTIQTGENEKESTESD
jgi:hypothetical protein